MTNKPANGKVEELWLKLKEWVTTGDESDEQLADMRRKFYYGADWGLYLGLAIIEQSENKEEALRLFAAINAQFLELAPHERRSGNDRRKPE